jgi:hypothetical protein
MKFSQEIPCKCGGVFLFEKYGDGRWPVVSCTVCNKSASLMNHLSVDVTADCLLQRSKAELDNGDYTLSILISAIAVESFLTRMFLRQKGIAAHVFDRSTLDAQQNEWKEEYRRRVKGGFTVPADFISKEFTGISFDKFVAKDDVTIKIMAQFPEATNTSTKQYFQDELFKRRNEIAHWGYVNSAEPEAQRALMIAASIIEILKRMDKLKYGNL